MLALPRPIPATRLTAATSHPLLSIIGAPSSAGAYGPGQERAPLTFRHYGLIPHLRALGLDVTDRADGSTTSCRTDETNPTACNVDLVADVAAELADTVAFAMAVNHNVLVVDGDCTVELGTVAGATRDGARVGLHVETLKSVRDDLPAVAGRTREWAGQFDRVLVHVDADVLDFDQFSIAANTDSRSGLSLTELAQVLRGLCTLPN